MPLDSRPTLVMLAGPNGSGKSTLYETRIAPSLNVPFINADVIQRDELRTKDVGASYEAAQIASQRRWEFMKLKKSFATESVFSHPSKVEFIQYAKEQGYRILMFHVCVDHPDLSVARVAARVGEGGHDVPEDKIRARYERNGALIRQAVLISDIAHVLDNSKLNQPPRRMLTFTNGKLSFVFPHLTNWVQNTYRDDLNALKY